MTRHGPLAHGLLLNRNSGNCLRYFDWLPCVVAVGCEGVYKALYWPADAPSPSNSSTPATKWPTGWRVWPEGEGQTWVKKEKVGTHSLKCESKW